MTEDSEPDILTPEQAAEYLQSDLKTVYRHIREGKLDASKLDRSYRIPRSSLSNFLRATRTRPSFALREYTEQEIAEFIAADALDDEARLIADEFLRRATSVQ